ncbi:hypothetical protein GCM10009839_07440 [Catenulispora yoronensis]|uniref:Uncharacterized protein n=1 Tax=Catenulispora yoronensis TaxID=450799 RepID=A0ABP5F392_9ACTN
MPDKGASSERLPVWARFIRGIAWLLAAALTKAAGFRRGTVFSLRDGARITAWAFPRSRLAALTRNLPVTCRKFS